MNGKPWTTIEWTTEMSVGLVELDDDHKGLIAIINRLGDSLDGDERSRAALGPAFRALRQYMRVHFAREEEAMRAAGYAAFDDHRGRHKAFIEEIGDMAERFEAGSERDVLEDLTVYLRDWLINHILVEDMAYKPYLVGNDKAKKACQEFSALNMWSG